MTITPTAVRGCRGCGHAVEAHSPAVSACTICTRYKTLVGNAKKVRRDGSAPGVEMTLAEFAEWFTTQERVCTYCHIPEELIGRLGVRTQVGHLLQRLGLDRLDTTAGYTVENIALCCFGCNKARSNTFSAAEMKVIGVSVAQVWQARLAALEASPATA
jgi:hypothetical protein